MVHAFGVVPDVPAIQSCIERRNVEEKFSAVVVGILILHGAVESFAMRILFRRPRARFVMREVESMSSISEVFLEFGAIVGEHVRERKREYLAHDRKELFCGERGM